jgi:pilus assembly protein Flp/PilA
LTRNATSGLGNYQYMPINTKLSDRQGVIGTGTEDQTRRLNMTFFKNLLRDEQGATAIEYGLIAALIAVAAITAMTALGGELTNTFNAVEGSLQTANAAAPAAP